MPFSVTVEPTTACNLRCPECPTGNGALTRKKGNITTKLFEKIAEEISSHAFYMMLYFQGEPLLHPNISKLISLAREKKIYVTLSTNGNLLNEEKIKTLLAAGVNRIIISLDGINQKTYEKYRVNGNIKNVLSGLQILSREIKKQERKPRVIIQFIVSAFNEHQLISVSNYAKQLDFDFETKSMQMDAPLEKTFMLPTKLKYRRYKIRNGKIKSRKKSNCRRIWSTAVITYNGQVVPCCFDKNADFSIDNIQDASLKQIWFGERFQVFRKKVLHQKDTISICRNCDQ